MIPPIRSTFHARSTFDVERFARRRGADLVRFARAHRRMAVALVGAAVLGLAWHGPLALRMIEYGDYGYHLLTAETFADDGEITLPHFMLQVLLGSLYATGLFSSIESAGLQFSYALYAATAMVLCWFIARESRGAGALACSAVLAVVVLMAAPIFARSAALDVFLIGYFPPNTYHNPTMLLSKPWLVVSLAAGVAAVTRTAPLRAGDWLLVTLPVALLGIAKPNYLGCLVPATVAFALWRRWNGRAVSWVRVGLFGAAALVSLGGTWLLYQSGELGTTGGIIFAPFAVLMMHLDADALALMRLLLASLAFPLAGLLLWPRAIWRDPASWIAWMALPFALFISYFLAERGERIAHGNFLWTGQMAVFVLFVTTAAFARGELFAQLERKADRRSWWTWARLAVLLALLLLHAESGFRHVRYVLDPGDWLAWWTTW